LTRPEIEDDGERDYEEDYYGYGERDYEEDDDELPEYPPQLIRS
jgi:hypothetical protein